MAGRENSVRRVLLPWDALRRESFAYGRGQRVLYGVVSGIMQMGIYSSPVTKVVVSEMRVSNATSLSMALVRLVPMLRFGIPNPGFYLISVDWAGR